MNSKFTTYNYPYNMQYRNVQNNDTRLAGGFLGPFILGGITGGLVSPLFYGGYNNRPVYYYQPGPYSPQYYPNYYGPRPF